MNLKTEHCRSCGATIVWAETAVTGRPNPIDSEPAKDGNVRLQPRIDAMPLAHYYGKTAKELLVEKYGDAIPWFKSHFATCPHAAKHRKK